MRIAVIDISNKVPLYDNALCGAIFNEKTEADSFVYLAPFNSYTDGKRWYKRLMTLVPKAMSKKYSSFRKILKSIESILNYIYIVVYLKVHHIDVAHFQWLPFLDYSSIEVYFLSIIKKICPNIRIVLTNHNIIPHDFSEQKTIEYKKRFNKVSKYIDRYIVHTQTSKNEFSELFGINQDLIDIVYHGIFVSDFKPSLQSYYDSGALKVTMFGSQSFYKGTDIFINSIDYLQPEDRKNLDLTIIGPTPESFYLKYCDKAKENQIKWINNWVTMDELQKTIDSSDIIVLPYRKISQSGVLLQALYFRKLIIASDLPSFKETLKGFSDDMFFESENPEALALLLKKYINDQIDTKLQYKAIDKLNDLYTWQSSAQKTLKLYKELIP